jgi:sulfur relay (sulfurtransferase) complex TusBCD TusD component (DsrE family)
MKATLTALALSALTLSAAQASELFVNIHSGATMAQGAGLVLAGQALEQKATVRVLLCDAAADIAVNNATLPALKPRNVTPQQMLQGLIKGGAKVEVCALYLPNSGKQASDLIPGVTPAKPAEVATHLLKPGVQILSF